MGCLADVPNDLLYMAPGGQSAGQAATCARAGCPKPARGTGGTSKYCCLACLEADESSDEEDTVAATSPAVNEQGDVAQEVPVESTESIADEAAATDGVGVNTSGGELTEHTRLDALAATQSQSKFTAMSIATLESNYSQAESNLNCFIFLDVDGVLNYSDAKAEEDDIITSATPMMRLSRKCMRRLVELVQGTSAHLVLSSSWRISEHLKADLWEALVAEGLPTDAFVGQTPSIEPLLRHFEIKEWLEWRPSVPWVVLDDMKLDAELKGNFVWIDPAVGLSDANVESASGILLTCGIC